MMTTVLSSKNSENPLKYIQGTASIFYNTEKRTGKILDQAITDTNMAIETSVKYLEEINQKKWDFPELKLEEIISSYIFTLDVLKGFLNAFERLLGKSQKDPLYNSYKELAEKLKELNSIIAKTLIKLQQIQNSNLTSSLQHLSQDSLESVWENEDELWSNFYSETIK